MGLKEPTPLRGGDNDWKEEKTGGKNRARGNRCKLTDITCLVETLEAVVAAGAYISLGETSDGGSILLRVLDGDTKLTSYSHSKEELEAKLEVLKKRYVSTYPF